MARNKKPRRIANVHKTPGKVVGRSPRLNKPKLHEVGPISERKKKMRDKVKEIKRMKQLRERIIQERKKTPEPKKSPLSRKQILYPPIPPPPPPGRTVPSTSSLSSKLTPRRRKRNKQPLKPSNSGDTIVIDSEDDYNSSQPLFYVDTTAGFNDKEVPQYSRKTGATDEPGLMIIEESVLEDGELRDEEDKGEESNILNRRVNHEEIPIDEEDDVNSVHEQGDDDVVDCDAVIVPKPKQLEDQSVIFCSEVIDLVGDDSAQKSRDVQLDFIPIGFDVVEGGGHGKFKRSPRKKLFKDLQSKKPTKSSDKHAQRKQKQDKNKEAVSIAETSGSKKRLVVIDGNNVAFAHTQGQAFSVKGLDICIQYFKKLGHEVKAVVPQFRLKKEKSTDQRLLEDLYKKGDVLLAPSKNLPGQKSSSYDDRLIISVAEKFDGVIISNDNFRDLLAENDSWKKIIETRVAGYTWAMDAFFLPDDPYGRKGPTLSDMLQVKATVDAAVKDK